MTTIVFKGFTPGEARDADGKWTSGPGGGREPRYAGVGFDDSRKGEHAVFKHGGKAHSGKIVGHVWSKDGVEKTHLLVQAHDGSGTFKVSPGAHWGTFGKTSHAKAKSAAKQMNGG